MILILDRMEKKCSAFYSASVCNFGLKQFIVSKSCLVSVIEILSKKKNKRQAIKSTRRFELSSDEESVEAPDTNGKCKTASSFAMPELFGLSPTGDIFALSMRRPYAKTA